MFNTRRKLCLALLLLPLFSVVRAQEQDRKVEPTWLYRDAAAVPERPIDLSTATCHYSPLFGERDSEPQVPKSVARFGQLTIDAHGSCHKVDYSRREELIFVRAGRGSLQYGEESHALSENDFAYLHPGVAHALTNSSTQPLQLILATVRIPATTSLAQPAKLQLANLSELQEQTVGGHPKSVLYKLLIGPHNTHRDRINAAYNVVDFFLMDFAPAGTNFPHHHEIAEEIYLVLDGAGQMAAGSGADGVEGLRPAKAGDAYYFRPNCTVGFYNQNTPDAKAHILAIRVYVPMPKSDD